MTTVVARSSCPTKLRPALTAAVVALLTLAIGLGSTFPEPAASAGPSPEAKKACAKYKKKAKKLNGKAKAKQLKKYRKCLKKHSGDQPADEPPGDNEPPGDGDGGNPPGGGDPPGGEIPGPPAPPPGPPPGPPIDAKEAATALMADQEFYRAFATTYTSGEELVRLCANGSSFRRYTSQTDVSTTEYLDYGTWSIKSAVQGPYNGYTYYEAVTHYEGTNDGEPASGDVVFDVSPQTSQSFISGKEFSRRDLTGGC